MNTHQIAFLCVIFAIIALFFFYKKDSENGWVAGLAWAFMLVSIYGAMIGLGYGLTLWYAYLGTL